MKHGEKVAPITAAVTSLATLACCLPMGFAAAAATASLGMVVATYQRWFLGASVVLLVIGMVQLRQVQRTCSRQPYSSFIVFGVSAVVVVLVVLAPQVVAGIVADWLP
jgi:MFS superfamily sulfate permease-like transporter